jgi:hypothetical protein
MNQNSSTGNIIGVNAGQDIGYLAELKGIQKNVSWWRQQDSRKFVKSYTKVCISKKLAMRFNNNVVIKTHRYFFFKFFYSYKLYSI